MQSGRTTVLVLFLICNLRGPEAAFYLYLIAIHYFMLSLNNPFLINVLFLTLYVSVLHVQFFSVSMETDMDGYTLMENAITLTAHL